MADQYQTEKENWNIAGGYVNLKLLLPLIESDKLLKIAIYGCENISEIQYITPTFKTQLRLEALDRFIDNIKMTIENSYRLLNKKGKDEVTSIQKRITEVEKTFDRIKIVTTDVISNQQEIQINEQHFKTCLDILRSIKTAIPGILNDSNLIFPSSEEIDLEAEKERLIHGG